MGLGSPTYLVGMAINARADDRCWQTLPGRLVIVPLDVPFKRMDLDVKGYRRLDNVLNKKLSVDFSRGAGNGVPVGHVALLADRRGIERAFEEGIAHPLEVAAGRTKERVFADKVELTKEGGR